MRNVAVETPDRALFLLDTNVISELRKQRPHGAVLAWFGQQEPSSLLLCAVTLLELQAGCERTRRQDPRKAVELDLWITGLQQRFVVLPFGGASARTTAAWMAHLSPDYLEDAMIAATALTYGLTVATRNLRDFQRFAIPVFNPFQTP